MITSRRSLLALAPALMLAVPGRGQTAPPACADPATLPLMQKSRRKSLGYLEASGDPKKMCRLCAFFTAGSGVCGTCQIFSGGPVNAGGVCNSFAAKAA